MAEIPPAGPLPSLQVTPETVLIDRADHTLMPPPFVTQLPSGAASIPAHGFGMSQFHTADGRALILFQLSRQRLVLHEAFTPEGARLLAQGLLRAADACEAAMLERSNAQLDEALAKGKGA